MANVEFEGKDLEEAIVQAARALGLPPENLKFHLISMGAKGFLGLGRRKARISVDPDDPSLSREFEEPDKKAPLSAPRLEKSSAPSEASAAAKDKRPAGRRERHQAAGQESKQGRRAEPEEELPPLDWSHVLPPLTQPGPAETFLENRPDDPEARLVVSVLEDILKHLGLAADIKWSRIASRMILTLDGEDNALLIGVRGATLEALQLLTAKIVARRLKEKDAEADLRVVLDVAGYRLRRHNHLLEILGHMAAELRRGQGPQTINGLSSAERRLIQMALRPYKDLCVSSGAGRDALLISSASAPTPRHPQRRRGRFSNSSRKNSE